MVYELKCKCGNTVCRETKPDIKDMEKCDECRKLYDDWENLQDGE